LTQANSHSENERPATYRGSLLYAKEAKKRQQEHGGTAPGRPKNTSGNLALSVPAPQARDHAAKAVGASPRYARVTDRYHPGTPVPSDSYPCYPAPDTLT